MSARTEASIGIVSALWKESAAMRALVKDIERAPARDDGDRNHYLEGWLPSTDPNRPHRVVLALLPQDGNGNASSVCTDLFRSYPRLECVIMCGIGGGIPSPTDPDRHVRLGDIVVADSIVSYGHVRRVDGRDVLRRPTDGISADLTRAVNELRIGELNAERPWQEWLDGTDPRLARFARPGPETDVLYVDGRPVPHPDAALSGHTGRWPKLHYGPIGSADVLLRDEVRRDDLAETYRLLAVEMESSGIVSAAGLRNRPWFAVRGIVDYCENAGKNDAWHLYSSLAAAAYLRALLATCHPFGPAVANPSIASPALSESRPRRAAEPAGTEPAGAETAGAETAGAETVVAETVVAGSAGAQPAVAGPSAVPTKRRPWKLALALAATVGVLAASFVFWNPGGGPAASPKSASGSTAAGTPDPSHSPGGPSPGSSASDPSHPTPPPPFTGPPPRSSSRTPTPSPPDGNGPTQTADPGRNQGVQQQRDVELIPQHGYNWVDIEYWRHDAAAPGELQMNSQVFQAALGAKLAVIPDTPLADRQRCSTVTAWRDQVPFSELHVGSQLCGRSRAGRLASLQVQLLPTSPSSEGRFMFHGITWK